MGSRMSITLNARLRPLDRGARYEIPLQEILGVSMPGSRVTGAGSLLSAEREPLVSDIDLDVDGDAPEALELVTAALEAAGGAQGVPGPAGGERAGAVRRHRRTGGLPQRHRPARRGIRQQRHRRAHSRAVRAPSATRATCSPGGRAREKRRCTCTARPHGRADRRRPGPVPSRPALPRSSRSNSHCPPKANVRARRACRNIAPGRRPGEYVSGAGRAAASWRPRVASVEWPDRYLARALAVLATRPAAWPALAFLEFLLGPANAAFPGHLLLGILNPADELIAGQRRDVLPGIKGRGVGDQRLAQVYRKLVHHSTGHALTAHRTRITVQGERVFTISAAPILIRRRAWRGASGGATSQNDRDLYGMQQVRAEFG